MDFYIVDVIGMKVDGYPKVIYSHNGTKELEVLLKRAIDLTGIAKENLVVYRIIGNYVERRKVVATYRLGRV